MKLSIYFFTFLITTNVYASFELNNTLYSDCKTCESDADFIAFAKFQRENNGAPLTQVIANSNSYNYFRSGATPVYKTVKYKLVPIRLYPEPLFRWDYVIKRNSAQTNLLFQDYWQLVTAVIENMPPETQGTIKNMQFRQTGILDIGAINVISNDMTWYGTSDFASHFKSKINNSLNNTTINPFLFLSRPMILRIQTFDNYLVYLTPVTTFSEGNWKVMFATDLSISSFYKSSGESFLFDYSGSNRDICVAESAALVCKTFPQPGVPQELFEYRDMSIPFPYNGPNDECSPGGVCPGND